MLIGCTAGSLKEWMDFTRAATSQTWKRAVHGARARRLGKTSTPTPTPTPNASGALPWCTEHRRQVCGEIFSECLGRSRRLSSSCLHGWLVHHEPGSVGEISEVFAQSLHQSDQLPELLQYRVLVPFVVAKIIYMRRLRELL